MFDIKLYAEGNKDFFAFRFVGLDLRRPEKIDIVDKTVRPVSTNEEERLTA